MKGPDFLQQRQCSRTSLEVKMKNTKKNLPTPAYLWLKAHCTLCRICYRLLKLRYIHFSGRIADLGIHLVHLSRLMGLVCVGVLFHYKSTIIHFMSGLQKKSWKNRFISPSTQETNSLLKLTTGCFLPS